MAASTGPQEGPETTISFAGKTYRRGYSGSGSPLSRQKYDALKESIRADGRVHVPVYVTKDESTGDYMIIDGHHRLKAVAELGLPEDCVVIHVLDDLTEAQKKVRAVDLNAIRRQMTQEENRDLIEVLLKADPNRSDNQIADKLEVSHNTVGAVRRRLERTGQIDKLVATVGKDGIKRPRRTTRPARQVQPPADTLELADESTATPSGTKAADPTEIDFPAAEGDTTRLAEAVTPDAAPGEAGGGQPVVGTDPSVTPSPTGNRADPTAILEGDPVPTTPRREGEASIGRPSTKGEYAEFVQAAQDVLNELWAFKQDPTPDPDGVRSAALRLEDLAASLADWADRSPAAATRP